jgi:hypothetical protein
VGLCGQASLCDMSILFDARKAASTSRTLNAIVISLPTMPTINDRARGPAKTKDGWISVLNRGWTNDKGLV